MNEKDDTRVDRSAYFDGSGLPHRRLVVARSSDDMLRSFTEIRAARSYFLSERNGLLCERAEPVSQRDHDEAQAEATSDPLATFEFPQPTQEEACWKMARKWEDGPYRARFYFDPPQSEWCESCRRRQKMSEAYRSASRQHGAALRGLIRRGKRLMELGKAVAAVDPVGDSRPPADHARKSLSEPHS